jgi:hypothetical protein
MKYIGEHKRWIGLSTDTKPSGNTGDTFFESDTGNWYVYNDGWSCTGKEELK